MFTKIQSWLAKPFNEQMSAVDWVLFLGLLFAASIFWTQVLKGIKRIA
jgi:hypothetical protein